MEFSRLLTLSFALATVLISANPFSAQAADGDSPDVKAGFLRCDVEGGVSFIFGSSRDIACTFERPDKSVERYTGTIEKYGVDIGYTKSGVMVWGVLAGTPDVIDGSLRGKFIGVGADAAVGYGVGADVLILGGDHPKVALQPLSIEGIEGINIAAGISQLELVPET
ncbi:DUF992 domain-containing protein [Pelagibius sp. Alg239-R121]|uniref:DUF992 domain-containing protein n=1 Tax=Pelagibius sp. Alg239-R121 TaxID=2993448 RepID=UPI0024A710FD|nr:DUF992 domain-containing protein [Pelagibius sp. Alg239-R121]